MKIGIVLPSVPGYSETFFTSKIKGLQANGFEVVLFVNAVAKGTNVTCKIVSAPCFSKNKIKNGFFSLFILLKVLFFHFKNTQRLYQLDKNDDLSFKKCIKSILINSHLLSQKLDWVHFGFGTMALDRENVAEAIGAKMAVSFRGFDHYVYPIKNEECYKSLFTKEVKYHVLSEGMKTDLVKMGIKKEGVIKITPAINTELFLSEVRNQSGNNFLTVARLHWIKGLDYTLEALALLNEQGIDFTYTIIGDGVEEERLRFLVHQLGLTDKVVFLGKLVQQEVQKEMEKATYYIQYSLQEGFCNAVLEAQAMGLLCIVSDAEGLTENVIHNETGFVVPKRNPAILAAKIVEVINLSQNEKQQLINKAMERIKTNFTLENQIKQFVDFYKS